jgi:hypothetical protein
VDVRVAVRRPLTARDLATDPAFDGPEFAALRGLAVLLSGRAPDMPVALQLEDVPDGYLLGAGVRLVDGSGAGRQLYCINVAPGVLLCDGAGEASNLRFTGVAAGDTVHVDNRAFLAYCYYARYHLRDTEAFDSLRLDGRPLHPQYEQPEMSPFMGVPHTGRFPGKMMWVHHTHDSSLWPSLGVGLRDTVVRERGPEAAREHFRLRWTDNAEHVPPAMIASPPGRANSTWLIDYQPVIEQCLVDLTDWVERGVEPAETAFSLVDGRITLPGTAAERGGIQPVVAVTADGAARAEVAAGSAVSLQVHAEVPAGAGTIVSVAWDFDGSGTYPERVPVDGTTTTLTAATTRTFSTPGTYFVTALVESHRDGDVDATFRRIPNLASARVVVR